MQVNTLFPFKLLLVVFEWLSFKQISNVILQLPGLFPCTMPSSEHGSRLILFLVKLMKWLTTMELGLLQSRWAMIFDACLELGLRCKGFIWFAEPCICFFLYQVSHHPPMGAAHAENEHFSYDITSKVKTKFLGNSVDVYPLGR